MKSLSALIIAVVLLGGCSPTKALKLDGTISWWPAEGNANDGAGPNHGQLVGRVRFIHGVAGQGFYLSQPGDMIEVPHNESLNLETMTGSTFTGWFKSNGGSRYGGALIVGKHTCGMASGWFFTTTQGCFLGDHFIGGIGIGELNLDDGEYHHFACVKDGSSYYEYIDGSLLSHDQGPEKGTSVNEPVQIGSMTTGICDASEHQTYGLIDEVRLYSRSLSAKEVHRTFSRGQKRLRRNAN